ncbi:Methylsterol monooxygenase 2-2 [Dinochytrium kinnereticum]|nr:Methylsterol monooxygenase 2-2 [Dinochytrium kinnereticum]
MEGLPEPQRTIFTYVLVPFATSAAANFSVSALAEILDAYAPQWFWDRYKILYKDGKRDKYPFGEVLMQSLYAQVFLLVTSMSGAVIFPPFLKMTQSIPKAIDFGRTLLLMALIDDLWFYINHRTLHMNKWLWENVHSLHHKMMNPTALSTNYLHPLEMLLVSIGTLVATAVVRPHYIPFIFFIFVRTAEDVGNHSGWDFPFLLSRWIPGHVTARFHDTHHALSNYQGRAKNLATTFTFWDKLFGTFSKGYQKRKTI